MQLVRQLIYKEKTIDDFDIDSNKSIFKLFFDLLLNMDGTRVTDMDAAKKITDIFNDACFISNAVIQLKRPYMHYGYLYNLASSTSNDKPYTPVPARGDIVMCLVYFLLGEHGDNTADIERLRATIEADIKKRCEENNNCFMYFCDAYENSQPTYLTDEFVVKLPITPDDLKRVCWSDISRRYDKQSLKEIVSFWSDPHDRNLIIDDIEKEIKQNTVDDLPF